MIKIKGAVADIKTRLERHLGEFAELRLDGDGRDIELRQIVPDDLCKRRKVNIIERSVLVHIDARIGDLLHKRFRGVRRLISNVAVENRCDENRTAIWGSIDLDAVAIDQDLIVLIAALAVLWALALAAVSRASFDMRIRVIGIIEFTL